MIIIPDKLRRPAEVERGELRKHLAEAQAEIERKNEELDMFLAEQQAMNKIIARKDKLIEQMREAFERINSAAWRIKLAQGNAACSCESLNAADIIAWSSEHKKATLSAAERGGG